MSNKYDVIVLGTGPAGISIAEICSKEGLNVASIEDTKFGGTCPNRGCTPKKILSSVIAKSAETNRLVGRGIQSETEINWKDLMALKRDFIDPMDEDNYKKLQEKGVSTYHGVGSFISDNEIKVNDEVLYGDKIVIATGAKPMELPIDGFDLLTMNDGFLDLDELPKNIVFVGGGYISFEFAHIAARSGSKVTILEGADKALGAFDPDLTKLLIKRSKEIGIDLHLETMVNEISKEGDIYTVKGEKDGEELEWEANIVVHGAGRVPNVDALDLKKGHVESDKKGVCVNGLQQSISNPNIFAVGDVAKTDGAPLTPVAHLEANLVVNQLLDQDYEKIDYYGIPSVAFTTPKIGMVGMSEADAKESDKNIEIKMNDMTDWFSYRHLNQPVAAVKIIRDKDTDKILGAHVLADEADQLINYFAAAMQLGLTREQLKNVTYAFPTNFSDIKRMFK